MWTIPTAGKKRTPDREGNAGEPRVPPEREGEGEAVVVMSRSVISTNPPLSRRAFLERTSGRGRSKNTEGGGIPDTQNRVVEAVAGLKLTGIQVDGSHGILC